MTFPTELERLLREATNSCDAQNDLEALLANHAPAILELVRAAEVMCGHADGDDLEAEAQMVEALAKLNGGKG